MKRFGFMLKQLLPLIYVSNYRSDGKKYLTVWRQWLFKPFNVSTYEVR